MSPSHSPRISQGQHSPTDWNSADDNDPHYLQDPLDYVHGLSQRGLYAISAEEDLPIQMMAGHASSSRGEPSSYTSSWHNSSLQSPLNPLGLSPHLVSLPYEEDRAISHTSAMNSGFFSPLDYSPQPRHLPQIHVDTTALEANSPAYRMYDANHSPLEMRSNGMHGPNMTYSSPSSAGSLPPLTPIASPVGNTTPFLNPSPISPSQTMVFTALGSQQSVSYDPHGEGGLRETVAEIAAAYATPYDGIFVPQKTYKPHTQSDRRRYVEDVELEAPIIFYTQGPSGCGIPLRDALNSRFMRLMGRDDLMFQNRGPSVSIRLMWPGYAPWSRQIPTRDFRSPPGPITRSKLAKNVAKTIQRFIDEMEGRRMEDETEARWRVGKNHIQLDDLLLVGLQHVSMGSWQAYVRLLPRH